MPDFGEAYVTLPALDEGRPERQFTPGGYRKAKADARAACGCAAHSRRKAAGVDLRIKAANRNRLHRIEGQIRGIERMVDEDRYCPDILVQIASVEQALRAVARGLMRNHLEHCVAESIRKGSGLDAAKTYDELLDLIYRYSS